MDLFNIKKARDDGIAHIVRRSYEDWPPGHRMHNNIPGLLAAAFMTAASLGAYRFKNLPLHVQKAYATAGHSDHPHVGEILFIIAETTGPMDSVQGLSHV